MRLLLLRAGMRARCIKLLHDLDVLEIVGTGGDGANSFNISTTSSLVIWRQAVYRLQNTIVTKHPQKVVRQMCWKLLVYNITIPPEKSAELLKKINICFLFAQNYCAMSS